MASGAFAPDFEGTNVELSAIEERLRSIDQSLLDIRQAQREIERRVGDSEKWRAATETVIEMQIERINSVTDDTKDNTDWISRAKGGIATYIQLVSSVCSAVGMVVVVVKLVLFHG